MGPARIACNIALSISPRTVSPWVGLLPRGDVSVYCLDDEVATGGGFEMYQQTTPDWSIRESLTRITGTTPNGWRAVAMNLSGSVSQY